MLTLEATRETIAMPMMKSTLTPKVRADNPAKSTNVNFFFNQDSTHLKRKWADRQDFRKTTRPQISNEAPKWEAFESWRAKGKSGS